MSSNFKFSPLTRQQSFSRQMNQCACCGDSLSHQYDHGHHVIPNQSAPLFQPDNDWIKSSENCVILCETCHYRVHENGKYRNGAVAPASYFPYSHGGNRAAHSVWAIKLDAMWTKVK